MSEGRWKLVLADTGEHELFNLLADPFEDNNLYGRSEHQAIAERLRGRIADWQKRTFDDWESW
ncbi:hypothetical protein [Paenibacillus cymbidii]|uniref:hypothetical protein n=1 Tax=Paenibacillus cymbidii TaxID=1639034 RepID=UPI00108134D0|nr:hypothetical protein [Paenibacillus cymbidii]